ncbi:DNA cytosine methyltransferase [Afipia carboxidovorans]|uniref:DNA cytosine methyltransferase n=1 Tax=Afipia carboxidovorans TaxID=40137 RepID=UPI0030CB2E45
MRTVAFCEIDPFCRRVLVKHWPDVPCYDDVRTLTAARLRTDGIRVDAICGGFPCQDISVAGTGKGLAGERSGLWFEYARIIGELRPRYVIVENVAALLGRGMATVLGDLSALGYDAEWGIISAAAVGAPHLRERVWIVADASRGRFSQSDRGEIQQSRRAKVERASEVMAHAGGNGHRADDRSEKNPSQTRCHQGEENKRERLRPIAGRSRQTVSNTDDAGCVEQRWALSIRAQLAAAQCSHWWRAEPAVGRVADGVPNRVDRLRALGNAVVPQIPEIIGRAILAAQEAIGASS